MNVRLAILWLFSAPLFSHSVHAETIALDPAGFSVITCRGGSDTHLTVPFRRSVEFQGEIASNLRQHNNGWISFRVAGTPAFANNEFTAKPHYVLFVGDSETSGRHFNIATLNSHSLFIEPDSAELSDFSVGDKFQVIAHWTLRTLFPQGNEAIHLSSGDLVHERGTEILFFDQVSAGTDLAPTRVFFETSVNWKEVTPNFSNANNVVIPPGQSFVIRHPQGSQDTRLAAAPWVETNEKSYALRSNADRSTDNHLGSIRPYALKLSELGLEPSAFVESASTSAQNRKDELLVFDSSNVERNRSPSAIYFRVNGQWRKVQSGFPSSDNATIPPGAALVVRKAPSSGGTVWFSLPAP